MTNFTLILATLTGALAITTGLYRHLSGKLKREREAFIRGYPFPTQLRERLARHYPHWEGEQINLALRALRQFFLLCLDAQAVNGKKTIGMPSKAVDDAWHEFILMSRHYTEFCRHAFGRYLHHAPESTLRSGINDALVNTLEQFKSGDGGRLGWAMLGGIPLLFAADRALAVDDGYHYDREAMSRLEHKRQLRENSAGGGDISWGIDFGGCGGDGGGCGGCGGCGS